MIIAWDIKDQSPLHCLNIKFPSVGTHLEHGGFPLFLTNHGSLFVSAEDCVADLKLSTYQGHKQNTSHTASVVNVFAQVPQKNLVSVSCYLFL